MKNYHDLLRSILDKGIVKGDRTGTGTISKFGTSLRYDLSQGFPIVTTKYIHFKSVVGELLWFLKGDTNIKYLNDNGITIWDEFADDDGDIGPMYGFAWRKWHDGKCIIDQIADLIRSIRDYPNSRRHVISAWKVDDLPLDHLSIQDNIDYGKMALAPCHISAIFNANDGKLSCMVTMRSVDTFLGMPFNIASYALLTHIIARQTGLQVGDLVMCFADTHIYSNHVDQAKLQLEREPYYLPTLNIKRSIPDKVEDYEIEDFELVGYNHHPKIYAPISV